VYSVVTAKIRNSTLPLLTVPSYFLSGSLNNVQVISLTLPASCSEVKFTNQTLGNIKSRTVMVRLLALVSIQEDSGLTSGDNDNHSYQGSRFYQSRTGIGHNNCKIPQNK
jgi:hypothetical protein